MRYESRAKKFIEIYENFIILILFLIQIYNAYFTIYLLRI